MRPLDALPAPRRIVIFGGGLIWATFPSRGGGVGARPGQPRNEHREEPPALHVESCMCHFMDAASTIRTGSPTRMSGPQRSAIR
jgi:hypothetical protein